MALNIWTKPSGTSLGTIQEQVTVFVPLPIIPSVAFNGVPPPSYDGSGHHPTVPLRNSAGSAFARYPVNSYTDGLHAMRTDLANARTVSNLVVWDQVNEGETTDPTGYSGFMYAWGQFITHELAFERTGGANIDVIVPAGDTNLTPGSHIPVSRARVAPGTGINGVAALPINDVTGWIDGSVVYGIAYPPGVVPVSGFTNPVLLREGSLIATTGKLLTSSNGQYGPIVNGSFLFGDPRGTENPDLTSIQTLFIREHNWHVDQLRAANPSWTGEQLYQRARNIVIAEEQVITYKEWLPKIIGNDAISAYTGFKPDVDASIKVEFAAAALRFGHSIVSGAQDRVDEQGNVTEALALADAFFLTPAQFERNGGANGFLRKLASDISNKLDVYIIEDLRNLLNDPPAALDLAATNIQRGRDLGLPSLNQMRVALGFSAYTSFSQITSDATTANALHSAYVNINDIDLWVGGLAEDRYPGAMVGPTFRAIIADQMSRLRDGDQSWYQNQPWNPTDLTWINNTTLSDIILRNTDTVHMQTDAFVAVERADLISGAVPSIVARSPSTSPPPLSDTAEITFTVISGALPDGLYLKGASIIGSPYIVANQTKSIFCIRASNGSSVSDRTFSIDVLGYNPPTFVTPAGYLPVGPNDQLYTIDQTYIEYQLEVTDLNIALGNKVNFSILSGDGKLPPGLTLSPSGLISGFIQPAPVISVNAGVGSFDSVRYDGNPYDFGLVPTNGYDSYAYDDVIFDYFTPTLVPQSLSLNYVFRVTATDGLNYSQRIFKIFVAGSDEFRADSTTPDGKADGFTADSTYVRRPVWLTASNLGLFRSNNYLTVTVALYNDYNVVFRLDATNHETYAVAYQISNSDNVKSSLTVTIEHVSVAPIVGQYFTLNYFVANATEQLYKIVQVTQLSNTRYRVIIDTPLLVSIPNNTAFYIGTLSTLPNGVSFDALTGDIYGLVPYQPVVTEQFTFTITASRPGDTADELVSSSKTFSLIVLGSVNSIITWNSPDILGTIDADYICTLSLSASTNISNAVVNYKIIPKPNQSLPPGISLVSDGELTGVVNQYYNSATNSAGLINFLNTSFDSGLTTFDRRYTFTAQAYDQYGYSALTKEFTVIVDTPNTSAYNNITARPYLIPAQRSSFHEFINNTKIFASENIYRPNDPNFGIQTNLTMLVYAGIENKEAAAYVGAMGLNVKRKRFQFGSYKTATAYDPVTNLPVYEVVYVQMIDPMEPNGKSLPSSIKTASLEPETITADTSNSIWQAGFEVHKAHGYYGDRTPTEDEQNKLDLLATPDPVASRPDYNITIDSTGYQTSNPNTNTYYPSSITNWQNRLKNVGASERNYLPLWMRSIQAGQKEQLGYILAVPLCFCKVGTSETILLNIKYYSDFDFKTLDFTIDRFTLTSLAGYISDKYLVFRNDRITV
jgi:hypothetical protein